MTLVPSSSRSASRTGAWPARSTSWATVIAGDCHYIKRYMPARLDGKVICTNTTTAEDVEQFRRAGVRQRAGAEVLEDDLPRPGLPGLGRERRLGPRLPHPLDQVDSHRQSSSGTERSGDPP